MNFKQAGFYLVILVFLLPSVCIARREEIRTTSDGEARSPRSALGNEPLAQLSFMSCLGKFRVFLLGVVHIGTLACIYEFVQSNKIHSDVKGTAILFYMASLGRQLILIGHGIPSAYSQAFMVGMASLPGISASCFLGGKYTKFFDKTSLKNGDIYDCSELSCLDFSRLSKRLLAKLKKN